MIIFLIILFIIFAFGVVILFGAPYLPTMDKQRQDALDLLDLKKGQTLIELGSGDGRMLNSAARRGLKVVGYELNPILYIVSILLTWKNRDVIKIHFGDFWQKQWPNTDGIYVFLHTRFMSKLDKKITQQYCSKNVKVVSYAFKIPGKTVVKTKEALYLYEY